MEPRRLALCQLTKTRFGPRRCAPCRACWGVRANSGSAVWCDGVLRAGGAGAARLGNSLGPLAVAAFAAAIAAGACAGHAAVRRPPPTVPEVARAEAPPPAASAGVSAAASALRRHRPRIRELDLPHLRRRLRGVPRRSRAGSDSRPRRRAQTRSGADAAPWPRRLLDVRSLGNRAGGLARLRARPRACRRGRQLRISRARHPGAQGPWTQRRPHRRAHVAALELRVRTKRESPRPGAPGNSRSTGSAVRSSIACGRIRPGSSAFTPPKACTSSRTSIRATSMITRRSPQPARGCREAGVSAGHLRTLPAAHRGRERAPRHRRRPAGRRDHRAPLGTVFEARTPDNRRSPRHLGPRTALCRP